MTTLSTSHRITVTREDARQVEMGQAYCPLSAALARIFPGRADPFHIGYQTCTIAGELWYIGRTLQENVLDPADEIPGAPPLDLPVTGHIYRLPPSNQQDRP